MKMMMKMMMMADVVACCFATSATGVDLGSKRLMAVCCRLLWMLTCGSCIEDDATPVQTMSYLGLVVTTAPY